MNRKHPILSLVFIAVISLFAWSCAKQKAPLTPYDRIQGKWKLSKYGSDDNLNGRIESKEMHPLAAEKDDQIVFNSDGTGVSTSVQNGVASPDLAFRWDLFAADSVKISYAANDTLIYYISGVSDETLILTTQGKISLEWYSYIKL